MITRDGIIQYADQLHQDYEQFCLDGSPTRIPADDVRELQEQFNVNQCDECDGWFDTDPPNDGTITIIEELEFWERFGDVETI